jgi:hypothetical protein
LAVPFALPLLAALCEVLFFAVVVATVAPFMRLTPWGTVLARRGKPSSMDPLGSADA